MRRVRLALLVALFTLGLLPHASASASGSPRASGHITAREVADIPDQRAIAPSFDPAAAAALSIGSTGGPTLAYTSPVIAAGQLFDHVGIHWSERAGVHDPIGIDVRTSADGLGWNAW